MTLKLPMVSPFAEIPIYLNPVGVTALLGDLPLFRKLDIVCQTIGATYEVFGTEIVISGGTCNL